MDGLLSFACLKMEPKERAQLLLQYDSNGDGCLNRLEFCRLCIDHLWEVPIGTLELAVANYLDSSCAATEFRSRMRFSTPCVSSARLSTARHDPKPCCLERSSCPLPFLA